MKKKLLAIALCLCTAFSFTACGGDDSDGSNNQQNAESTEAKITLGEYKGLKVDSSLATVDQTSVQQYLDSILTASAETEEITEGVLAEGNKIRVSYTSTVDGAEYKNGEGSTVELTDSGFIVEGFTDGLIGHSVGDTVELDLKLPDNFSDTDVAGKDIHFSVTIEAILNTVVPEFTDEYVTGNFGAIGLSTKDDLLNYLERDLRISQIYSEIWEEIVTNATVDSYDEEKLSTLTQERANYQEYQIYDSYGVELATYLEAFSVSEEEFMSDMEEYAKSYLKEEMVINAIAEAEGIEITDEVYQDKMMEIANAYGFATVSELEEYYAESMTKEDFEYKVRTYLVQEFVCENVEFVEGYGLRSEQESETSSEDATEGESTEDTTEGASE